jgi:AAA+ superfamily predicted ATPase
MNWPTPEKTPVPKPFEDLKSQFLALETRTRLSMEEMLAHLAVTDASGKNFRSEPFAHYLALSISSVIVAFMALDECPTLANYRMFCEAHDLFRKDKQYANASDEQLQAESENFRKSVASIPRVEGETLPAIQILEQYDEQYRTQEAEAAREAFYKLADLVVGQLTPGARAPQTYLKVFRQALGLAAIPDPNGPHAGKQEPAPDLNTLLAQLDALTGLKRVKEEVRQLTNYLKVEQMRKAQGLKTSEISLHMVFYGNPGTGKTTVARLVAKIYRALGVVSKGHLIEVDRAGLVAGYVGQTAIKVRSIVDKAAGGLLFIDEAYSLKTGGDNDFGQEAIETLLKLMEDRRDDFVVVAAGYPVEMKKFLEANPGLKSRFAKYLQFDDYSPEELMAIFESTCKSTDYQMSEDARKTIADIFQKAYDARDRTFGNARFARNLFEKIVENQANRLVGMEKAEKTALMTIEAVDVTGPAQ